MNDTQAGPQAKRTDGLKRQRSLLTSPLGDSPAQLELLALDAGHEYFGPYAHLELDKSYSAADRWASVLTGKHMEPRYRGSIRVYELVPDGEES